jgi:hypothetical protein
VSVRSPYRSANKRTTSGEESRVAKAVGKGP